MRINTFGSIVAGAVLALSGSQVLAQAATTDAKACYRSHCGSSIKGYEGKCGGTLVPELKSQAVCEKAGGAWTTAAQAKKFEKAE